MAFGIDRAGDVESSRRLRRESGCNQIGIGRLVRVHVKAFRDLDDHCDLKRFSARHRFERNKRLWFHDRRRTWERFLLYCKRTAGRDKYRLRWGPDEEAKM